MKFTNELIKEKSPYLLQHAHNPVNWMPWGEAAFEKAKRENKPLLISIGYSACHWCHVMEHECFEDEQVADLMNRYFVNVKVDREERPDVDQLYMNAVQLMSGRGGWPLNCFILPDGRPIYGGTYFPKPTWMNVLEKIHQLVNEENKDVLEYAEKLTEGLMKLERFKIDEHAEKWNLIDLKTGAEQWKSMLDKEEGGPDKAPKFPLPNNYLFLLRFAHLNHDDELMKHVHLTLRKMAMGGIYDQLGGGFARYSVDALWKVPHFEKMLYDNAQLISLYAEAYVQKPNELYKETIYGTINWLMRELKHDDGYFYSALDADSDGEEGKFYVWTLEELKNLLSSAQFEVVEQVYALNEFSYWEHDNYILCRRESFEVIAEKLNIGLGVLQVTLKEAQKILLNYRNQRIKPGLDDKMLTAWNAMTIKALVDAYKAFGEEIWLKQAESSADFIINNLMKDYELKHCYKNGEAYGTGLLDDYAHVIAALLSLFETTANENYARFAFGLAEKACELFKHDGTDLLAFTPLSQKDLLVRHLETSDNVIPASNSVMANQFYLLSKIFGRFDWEERAQNMLYANKREWLQYPQGYSNWGNLALNFVFGSDELVITGTKSKPAYQALIKRYNPIRFHFHSQQASELPIFKNRFDESKLQIFRCFDHTCSLPMFELEEAMEV